jgi:hypothetical protein
MKNKPNWFLVIVLILAGAFLIWKTDQFFNAHDRAWHAQVVYENQMKAITGQAEAQERQQRAETIAAHERSTQTAKAAASRRRAEADARWDKQVEENRRKRDECLDFYVKANPGESRYSKHAQLQCPVLPNPPYDD